MGLMGDRITQSYASPLMPLIFATGPLVGTAAPTSGRISVVSKSPLTGTIFDCSVGGRFGTKLKRAGFDFIEITGVSDRWVMLNIDNKGVTIEDAEKITGENVSGISSSYGK